MKKWIILLVVLAAGAWGFHKWRNREPDTDAARLAGRPTTAVVETRDIRFSVNAAGDIGPADQVSVRPEINGKIDKLPVDIGDVVKEGALLFSLEDYDLQTEKQSQEREIERARLQLDQAKRSYDRAQQLHTDKLISQELFEDTKTQYDLAKNARDRAEKALDVVKDKLRKTQIAAPFNCTVLTRPVSVGQAVAGSGGYSSGTEVLTIANLNDMIINAHINQADVSRLKVGQEVTAQVEAVPGLKITGTVERIAPQATFKNNIKGFAVRIVIKDPDRRIRPGMTANIEIPVSAADSVVAVPLASVFTEQNPESQLTERYVYVKKGDGAERRPVQIGISDFFFAEVQKGLTPGEVVMLEMPKEDKITVAKAPPVVRTAGVPASSASDASSGRTSRVSEATRAVTGTTGQKPATSSVTRARGGS
jgi:RND family efflux transporter MFP subunit